MKFWVGRNGQKFGPYSEEQVRGGYEKGQLKGDDLLWSEGWKDWVRVDVALKAGGPPPLPEKSLPVPPSKPSASAAPAPRSPYTPPESRVADDGATAKGAPDFPLPPGLHWALVLLLSIVTLGAFQMIWFVVETVWTKKLDDDAPLGWAVTTCVLFFVGIVLELLAGRGENAVIGLLYLACLLTQIVAWLLAAFGNRRVMNEYFRKHYGLDLDIGALGTFFVGIYYHQWFMSKLRRWRLTGELEFGRIPAAARTR